MADNNAELVFLPLGGLGEIGMNLALYGYGPAQKREWIMVDCGVTFPGADLPGVDLILPDIEFVREQRANLKAMIITHAHEDHFGAINDLWPGLNVPIYASPFTAGLLESKRAYERSMGEIPITIFKAGDTINVGPFSVEAVAVNHSIPEPMALCIRTPLGNIVHTGDWKIDHAPSLGPMTDESRFRALGDEGILALMCDLDQRTARWRFSVGTGSFRKPAQGHRKRRRKGRAHKLLLQYWTYPFDCKSGGRGWPAGSVAGLVAEACRSGRPRHRADGRGQTLRRGRRIRLYSARQGGGDPHWLAGRKPRGARQAFA
nr:ribonuclease J [Marinicella sp. W31]MDC2877562.1 ribonuclease J [Marinicella sp. W31]